MVAMPGDDLLLLAFMRSSSVATAGEGPRHEAVITVAFENMYSGPDAAPGDLSDRIG